MDGTWATLKAQAVMLAELDDDIDGDAQVDATDPSVCCRGRKRGWGSTPWPTVAAGPWPL
jgi:hypothetical protein